MIRAILLSLLLAASVAAQPGPGVCPGVRVYQGSSYIGCAKRLDFPLSSYLATVVGDQVTVSLDGSVSKLGSGIGEASDFNATIDLTNKDVDQFTGVAGSKAYVGSICTATGACTTGLGAGTVYFSIADKTTASADAGSATVMPAAKIWGGTCCANADPGSGKTRVFSLHTAGSGDPGTTFTSATCTVTGTAGGTAKCCSFTITSGTAISAGTLVNWIQTTTGTPTDNAGGSCIAYLTVDALL